MFGIDEHTDDLYIMDFSLSKNGMLMLISALKHEEQ
jgi:hypothetical protein